MVAGGHPFYQNCSFVRGGRGGIVDWKGRIVELEKKKSELVIAGAGGRPGRQPR
jgi:hypothetical protein